MLTDIVPIYSYAIQISGTFPFSFKALPLGVPRETLPEEMDEETIKIDCYRKLRNREFLDEYHPEYDNRKLGQAHFKGLKIYWDKDKPPIKY